MGRFDLTDFEWSVIQPLVNGGGKTSHGAVQESATSGIWNGCRGRGRALARALPQ